MIAPTAYRIEIRRACLLAPWLLLATLTACGSRSSGDAVTFVVANADAYSVEQGQTLNVAPPGVLGNDIGTGLTAELVSPPSSHVGPFTLNADGSFQYVHNGAASVTDGFQYRVRDSASALSSTVTATINIAQPPTANSACQTILDFQDAVTGTLTATDPNGDDLTYTIVSQPANGTVSTTPAGVFTYMPAIPAPDTGRRGTDKFTFQATDSGGLVSQVETVNILNNGKVRIMPLGDSITEGIFSGDVPSSDQRVGYRKPLFDALVSAGFSIDFVGSQNLGFGLPNFDPDNEGHAGFNAQEIATGRVEFGYNGIYEALVNNPADIILLHIGTNDFNIPGSSSPSDVTDILNEIDRWESLNYPVIVVLARIIDRNPPDPGKDVTAFNDSVEAIAQARINDPVNPDSIIIVDQQVALWNTSNVPDPALYGDTLHPNTSGYGKMGDVWFNDALADVLMKCP